VSARRWCRPGDWRAHHCLQRRGLPGLRGDDYLFTGPQSLLGEFGWIAAISMLLLGLAAGWWHVQHPLGTDTAVPAQASDSTT
jgi:hypothetical protein